MRVRAITLSRNHKDYLQKSLPSARVGDWLRGTLIDNGDRDDGSAAYAESLGWDVIDTDPGIGFSAGNNLGAYSDQDADYYLLLNDDAVLGPDAVRSMLSHATWDVTGILITDPTTGLVNHAGAAFDEGAHPRHIGRGDPADQWLTKCEEVWSVTFAVALIKGETWRRLDGLDEGYHYGYEDTDFCMRVWESGGTVGCCRMTTARHGEFGTRPRGEDNANAIRFLMTWMQGRATAIPPDRRPAPR